MKKSSKSKPCVHLVMCTTVFSSGTYSVFPLVAFVREDLAKRYAENIIRSDTIATVVKVEIGD